MRVLIDNQDGLGSLDYTACVCASPAVELMRKLNQPSVLTVTMIPAALGLKEPAVGASVRVEDAAGALLFTGWALAGALKQGAGSGSSGQVSSLRVEAFSDEIMLDTEANLLTTTLLGQTASAQWSLLTALAGKTEQSPLVNGGIAGASRLAVGAGEQWTTLAKRLGDYSRTSYSAVGGQISVTPIGNVVHEVDSNDPGLRLKEASLNDLRWIANDVTVCGKEEPGAYITEVFQGDGVTTNYQLSQEPFEPAAAQRAKIEDLFQGNNLNTRLWTVADAGAHISLTANGLTCAGGTGRDGESSVASVQQLELGGVLTLEGGGVTISPGSSGIVLGLFTGQVSAANCVAGFEVSTSTSGTAVSPVVNGANVGASFTPVAGNLYTFRLRLYSPETERLRQTYFYEVNGVANSLGGDTTPSVGLIEFEVQNITSGVPGAAVVLYSGAIGSLAPAANLVLMDSGALSCSIRSVLCTQSLPAYVAVGAAGSMAAQFVGAPPNGGACTMSASGKIAFHPANVPAAGAFVAVNYRARQRAIARRSSAGNGAMETLSWIGSVTDPAPLSSVDCDHAAQGLLAIASQPSSRLEGTYEHVQQEGAGDLWPGDMLSITDASTGVRQQAVVRLVTVGAMQTVPPLLKYSVAFASESTEELGIRVSHTVPADAVIPQVPSAAGEALASLTGLTMEEVTGTSLTIQVGAAAPVNGGFEVRRRDFTFGSGSDSDLVLRSSSSSITLPRSSAVEQFFLRMYDGAQPPNYSLHSAAVFLNVPFQG